MKKSKQKEAPKKFEYFQIYGDVAQLPVGVVHKENLKEGQTPEGIAEEFLTKLGMTNFKAVEKSEEDRKYKITGSSVNFYSNDRSFIQLNWINPKTPAICLWQDAVSSKAQGIGIAFNDEQIFELFVHKVNQMYLAYKGRGQ